MRLEGKTALVTGGASGFGAGIAHQFHAEGARVMIADIDAEAAAAMAVVLGAVHAVADVGDDASVAAMAEACLAEFGHLDILVNNAGVTHLPAPLEEISEAEFDRVFRVNAKSVYLTARHLVPEMKRAGRRGDSQHRLDRRPQPASPAELVQRLEGLDGHRDEVDGGGAGAVRRPGERALPGGGRDAAAEVLPRRGHAGDAGEVPRDDPARTVLHAARPRARGGVSLSDEAAMLTGVALEVDGGRCI